MNKQAPQTYGIVAVCHSGKPRRIVEVKVRKSVPAAPNGPDLLLGEAHELRMNRAEVFYWMGLGARFYTFTYAGTIAVKGAEVVPVLVDGEKYLRTVPDAVAEDNLGELPEFACELPSP